MISPIITINGKRAESIEMVFPYGGAWYAFGSVDDDEVTNVFEGRAVLTVGTDTFNCTVVANGTGQFIDRKNFFVVGGGAGWSKTVPQKVYQHSAVGIMKPTIATDLANEVGESIVPLPGIAGFDFVRASERAGGVLDFLYPGWYVDTLGVTQTSPRVPYALSPLDAALLKYDPVDGIATFYVESLLALKPGAVVIDVRLTAPLNIKGVRVRCGAAGLTVEGWTEIVPGPSRLMSALRAATEREETKFLGTYRYRVTGATPLTGDELMLQCSSPIAGLPEIIPCKQWPGIGGSRTLPNLGSDVLVTFIDGDRTQPIVYGFAPVSGNGTSPPRVELQGIMTVFTGAVVTGSDPLPVDPSLEKRFVRYGDPIVFSAPGPGTVTAPGPVPGFSLVKGNG